MLSHDLPIRSLPQRVVSLVPSMTESLFDLGLGAHVVGATDYCIHPADRLSGLARVGGPKDFRVEDVMRLNPDMVIANQEENAESLIRRLMDRQIPVWLTFPLTVNDALRDLRDLAGLFGSETALRSIRGLEQSIEYCKMASAETQRRYFCPIWQQAGENTTWWMTFNEQTYSSDLLAVVGGVNIFAKRSRRYPLAADLNDIAGEAAGSRDTRYPRVTLMEIAQNRPDYLFFPDEPYPFSEAEQLQLSEKLARLLGYEPICISMEGSLITWPGTRISKALELLNGIFA